MYEATVTKLIKSETRRTHGLEKVINKEGDWEISTNSGPRDESGRLIARFKKRGKSQLLEVKSKYKVGEVLYIAEPMYVMNSAVVNKNLSLGKITHLDIPHLYRYDMDPVQIMAAKELVKSKHWKVCSPMFMIQQYGRRFIRITDIICEKVQEITRGAIIREGIEEYHTTVSDYLLRIKYSVLFDRINGPGAWDRNGYVFAYRYDYLPDYKRRLNA